MKNLKRIIALVAVFAMVLTTVSFAATYTDIPADSDYYEAVETLSKLNIVEGYEDGEYKADQNVTRAEMTALIARVLGIGETAKNQMATSFTDVPASHWASGFVGWASSSNVVKGYGDGTFGPENNVLYEEAVTMIMRALGYEVVAAGKGGYPGGFIAAAIQSGVTTDVKNAVQGTFANRGTIAQLLANAIDTPLVDQFTWNSDGTGEFIKYDGNGYYDYKTLMSEYLNVVKIKGVVTYTPFTAGTAYPYNIDDVEKVGIVVTDTFESANATVRSWAEAVEVEEDVYEVEPTVFNIAGTDAADYVSRSVLAYVHENEDDEWDIITVVPDSSRAAEIAFSIENLADPVVADSEKVRYYKNGADKKTNINLAEEFVIIVDGDVVDDIDPEDYEDVNGTVTVIDNAKTAGYEVVLVNTVVTDVVEDVTATKINFKNIISPIKYADDDMKVVIKKNGEIIEAADLVENDVVAVTGNEALKVIEVLTKTIEGTVSGTKAADDSESGKAYKIDGEYYNVAAGVSEDDYAKLKNGYEGTFYLDKFGEIVYFVGTADLGKIAYVLEVSEIDEDKWGKDGIEIKFLTVDGVKTYAMANTFKIDGELAGELDEDSDAAKAALDALVDDVVKFTLTNDKVAKLYTANEDNNFEYVTSFEKEWSAEDKAFGNKDIDANAVVFSINVEDLDESFATTIADFVDEDEYVVDLYATADTDADADIIVTAGLDMMIASKAEYAIITDVEETENEDEEDIFELTLMFKGEKATYKTTSEVYDAIEEDVAIGDVVKVKINAEDVITNIVCDLNVVRYNDGYAPVFTDGAIVEDAEYMLAGYAYYKSGSKVHILYDEDEDPEVVKFDKARRIYLVEATGRNKDGIKVTEASANDILWDKDLTIEIDDEEDEYDGKDVADVTVELTNDSEAEFTAANVFTQIIATFTDEGDVDMIFLIAGEDDYELAD
ncbi:MAG: S-layer homology domain-containing protein [Clostridia bacterium]|nr:S-layer homology domain-containing protein [Clostridia bacterium]